MHWKLYIDSAQQRALDSCLGSLTTGNGFGSGFGFGNGSGYGYGYSQWDGSGPDPTTTPQLRGSDYGNLYDDGGSADVW